MSFLGLGCFRGDQERSHSWLLFQVIKHHKGANVHCQQQLSRIHFLTDVTRKVSHRIAQIIHTEGTESVFSV